MSIKLSIIVTTFNIKDYIGKCLDSVINQTMQDIEIIVVDDASTDGTADIIREYATRDSRIVPIFFEENTIGGVASAGNAGLDVAKGDYIGFADGDDWHELDMFDRLYNRAIASNSDISFCNYLEYEESTGQNKTPSDNGKWGAILDKFSELYGDSETFRKLFLRFNPVPWRKIYKRSFLEENNIRFSVGDYFFEDNPFHWKTTVLANSFVFENFVGCYHRIGRAGQTMATVDNKILAMYEHHETNINTLKETGTFETYKAQLIGWLVGNTSWISEKIIPEYHQDLFDAFKKEISFYDKDFLENLFFTPAMGIRGTNLVQATLNNDFDDFVAIAKKTKESKGKGDSTSLANKSAVFALASMAVSNFKEEGLKSTLYKTKEFINRKYGLNIRKPAFMKKQSQNKVNQEILKELKSVRAELGVIKAMLALSDEDKNNKNM